MLTEDEILSVPVVVNGQLIGYSDEPGVLEYAASCSVA